MYFSAFKVILTWAAQKKPLKANALGSPPTHSVMLNKPWYALDRASFALDMALA